MIATSPAWNVSLPSNQLKAKLGTEEKLSAQIKKMGLQNCMNTLRISTNRNTKIYKRIATVRNLPEFANVVVKAASMETVVARMLRV